jgi:glutathione S-transferase
MENRSSRGLGGGRTLNEVRLLDGFPPLRAYMERMYARPHAPLRIAEAFARMKAGQA